MICISHIKKQIKNSLFLSILISAMLIFSSCENIFSGRENSPTSNSDDKTYLTINLNTIKSAKPLAFARTIYPQGINLSQLNGFILKGAFENGEEQELFTAEDSSAFSDKTLEILPGNWTFTLTASFSDTATSSNIVYSDSVNYEIRRGVNNLISFELKPQLSGNGGFEITVNLASSNRLDKVRATLTSLSGTVIETKDLEIPAPTNPDAPVSVSYSKTNITDENGGLEPGSYHLLFEFLAAKVANPSASADDWILVNQWESYVCIIAQKISTANLNLNFNELYTISYNNADGGPITDFYEGVAITKYSPGSTFTLPRAKISRQVFLGWKKQGSDEYISEIETSDREDFILTAEFADPVLYVSESGVDTNNGFSSSTPLKTVNEACNQIIKYGYTGLDWKIMISGETTGIPKGTSGINASFGQIEIPAEITSEVAKSILITGATPHGNWLDGDVPEDLDTINRGATSSTTNSLANGNTISGSALVINTEVPVTITNLKITGGFGGNGGGIKIAENARVSLGDGVLITYNRASAGGAIFNQGNLFIYGTAVIGDKDSTSFANYDSSSVKNGKSANYASSGGGIYNGDTANSIAATTIIANLYLGYRPSDDGSPEVSEWTGGIYFNGASSGGGIDNIAGRVEMSGGQILHNRAHYNSSVVRGGGICNEYKQSVFVMSGGTINENVAWARSGTNAQGGGVYNGGKMFMYGSAVIGDPDKNTQPSFTQGATEDEDSGDYGNRANIGGGIYNDAGTTDNCGKLYMGYKPDESDIPVEENLSGGVYYNYCKHYYNSGTSNWGGGGINSYTSGSGEFLLSSGTIAYNATGDDGGAIWMQSTTIAGGGDNGVSIHDNAATGKGNAIYVYSNQQYNLTLSGNIEIPFDETNPHDIYLAGSGSNYSKILIAGDLIGGFSALITPGVYDETHKLVDLASGSTANLEAETRCFSVTPQTKDDEGNELTAPVNWEIDSTGKLKVASSSTGNNFYVDTNGDDEASGLDAEHSLKTIMAAIGKMNDSNTDYVINVMGDLWQENFSTEYNLEITNAVNGKARSITLRGNADSGNYNFDGQSDGDGTTVMKVTTSVPIILEKITVCGGCADDSHLGGAIYIGEESTVILDQGTIVNGGGSHGYGSAIYVAASDNGGVTKAGSLIMKDNAVVNADDYGEVYLCTGATIKVASALTGQSSVRDSDSGEYIPSSIVAKITPQVYAENTPVIALTDDAPATLNISDVYEKFAVFEEEDTTSWLITNEGKLAKASNGGNGNLSINLVTVPGNGSDIQNLLVGKNLITQTEYEHFMKYHGDVVTGSSYKPSETGDAKNTTPAYYVSFVDAVIFCNLLSVENHLEPVYKIGERQNLSECVADISEWINDTSLGINKVDDKYCFAWDRTKPYNDNPYGQWDSIYDGGKLYTDESANGYRLATLDEIVHIANWNISNGFELQSYSGINEWCDAYAQNNKETGIFTANIADSSEEYFENCVTYHKHNAHEAPGDIIIGSEEVYCCGGGENFTRNLGFRVVRNAGANGGSNP